MKWRGIGPLPEAYTESTFSEFEVVDGGVSDGVIDAGKREESPPR